MHCSAKMDVIERILGSGRTRGVSFSPFLNSFGWWWLISSIFLIRISCHKTTHANGYYGAWPGWAISVSVLPLTLPVNIQGWFSLGWTGWISLQFKGLSRVFSNTISKASVLQCSAFFVVQLSHSYVTTRKTKALTMRTFVSKVMPLLFNMLSRLVITCLPRSKCLLISWLQSLSEVILDPRK